MNFYYVSSISHSYCHHEAKFNRELDEQIIAMKYNTFLIL